MSDNEELFNAIAAEPVEQVDLNVIRKKAAQLADAYIEKSELEQRVKACQTRITNIERKDLPDLFAKAKISSITVEPTGNHSGFVAELCTVYTAKIPEDDNIRQQALAWFEETGHGDLVKSVITIIFGMQEHEKRLRCMEILAKAGIEYTAAESVHHQTLKAFVKRELTAGRIIPQDLLGVFIFDEVKIK